jgi:hypothetical protein
MANPGAADADLALLLVLVSALEERVGTTCISQSGTFP